MKKQERKMDVDALREAGHGDVEVTWDDLDPDRPRKKSEQKSLGDYTAAILISGSLAAVVAFFAWPRQAQALAREAGPEVASPSDHIPYGLNIPGTEEIHISDTNSMDPTIDIGNVALAQKASQKDIRVGDIITYRDLEGDLVIHRVIEIGNDGEWWAITKGDNNEVADPPIRWNQVDKVIIGVIY